MGRPFFSGFLNHAPHRQAIRSNRRRSENLAPIRFPGIRFPLSNRPTSHEMSQTQNRRRRGVLLLWTRAVRAVHQFTDRAANRLLGGMRHRPGAKRASHAGDSAKERPGAESERVLLLSLRRIVGWSGRGCVVHATLAISYFVHGRLRTGFIRLRDLVCAGFKKTGLNSL